MKAVYEKPALEVIDLGITTSIASAQCAVREANLFGTSECKLIVWGELDKEDNPFATDNEACNVSEYCYHTSANIIFGS